MIDLTPAPKQKRPIAYPKLKTKRDELRATGRCICGPWKADTNVGKRHGVEHGPVYRGGKCKRCWDLAKKNRGGKHRS